MDIHGEATSEKMALGYYLDGLVYGGRRHPHPRADLRPPDPAQGHGLLHRPRHDRPLRLGDRRREGADHPALPRRRCPAASRPRRATRASPRRSSTWIPQTGRARGIDRMLLVGGGPRDATEPAGPRLRNGSGLYSARGIAPLQLGRRNSPASGRRPRRHSHRPLRRRPPDLRVVAWNRQREQGPLGRPRRRGPGAPSARHPLGPGFREGRADPEARLRERRAQRGHDGVAERGPPAPRPPPARPPRPQRHPRGLVVRGHHRAARPGDAPHRDGPPRLPRPARGRGGPRGLEPAGRHRGLRRGARLAGR